MTLQVPPSISTSREIRESAYRGDLQHKLDLHRYFNNCAAPSFLVLIAASSQAHYLRTERPDLVPANNPNGTPPSDHTVSTFFEHQYTIDNTFAGDYLHWVRVNYHR